MLFIQQEKVPDVQLNTFFGITANPGQIMLLIADHSYNTIITSHSSKAMVASHGFIVSIQSNNFNDTIKIETTRFIVGFDASLKVGFSVGNFNIENIFVKGGPSILKGNVQI